MNDLKLRSLAERAEFLHERLPSHERPDGDALAAAEARLTSWRKDALLDGTVFAERLRAAGLSESELLSMFADEHSIQSTGRASTPEPGWLALFRAVTSASAPDVAPAESSEDVPIARRFARFVDPFVEVGRSRLRAERVRRRSRSPFGPVLENALARDLRHALTFEATRTLVLELNVTRTLNQLRGDTSEE